MTVAASPPVLDRHGNPKPRMRGWIHRGAAVVAVPAAVLLVAVAPTAEARIACVIYGLTLAGLFTISSLYHIGNWTDSQRTWWRRADHSMIFLLIAGTYTPFCLLVLDGTAALVELAIVWAGALAGIAVKLYRVDLHIVSGFMYIGLGWVAAVSFPAMIRALDVPGTILLVAGGLVYSLGALTLALHWPGRAATTFGYHETWHTMTVVAATCHYVVILRVVLALP
jgi:hemolysin III